MDGKVLCKLLAIRDVLIVFIREEPLGLHFKHSAGVCCYLLTLCPSLCIILSISKIL